MLCGKDHAVKYLISEELWRREKGAELGIPNHQIRLFSFFKQLGFDLSLLLFFLMSTDFRGGVLIHSRQRNDTGGSLL